MFLETMERVFGGTDKIIMDTSKGAQGVVRTCRSTSCRASRRRSN